MNNPHLPIPPAERLSPGEVAPDITVPTPLEVHPSVSPLAAELLMKTTKTLLEHPEQYNQDWDESYCGTPCCILGHCVAHADVSSKNKSVWAAWGTVGLTLDQFKAIYWLENWPDMFRTSQNSQDVSPSTAIARIEHFLRTGE